MNDQETTTSTPSSAAIEPLDMGQAVWQLRVLLCGLGAALLVLSLVFNVFVWKQNRNITAVTRGRLNQTVQLDNRVKQLTVIANDLGNYSTGKPELIAIFSRYGVQLKPAASAAQP